MKIHSFVLGVLLVINPVIHASIFKWTDNHNIVHFSDKPIEGAEEIKLVSLQRNVSSNLPIESKTVLKSLSNDEKTTIVQPEDQATLRNSEGSVSLIIAVNPALKQGDKLQVILDGRPMGLAIARTVITLAPIFRGKHVLSVQRVDEKGLVRNTSNQVTIYMMPPKINPLKF